MGRLDITGSGIMTSSWRHNLVISVISHISQCECDEDLKFRAFLWREIQWRHWFLLILSISPRPWWRHRPKSGICIQKSFLKTTLRYRHEIWYLEHFYDDEFDGDNDFCSCWVFYHALDDVINKGVELNPKFLSTFYSEYSQPYVKVSNHVIDKGVHNE